MRVGALGVVAMVMLSGCGTGEGAGPSGPVESSPTEATIAESSATKPAPWQDESWGPLAVTTPAEGSMEAGPIQGTLRISDECVFLEHEGGDSLLVWEAGGTRWNEDAGTITVEKEQGEGEWVTLADGDGVKMGGGWGHTETYEALEWVSESPSACRTVPFWIVGHLEKTPAS